MHSHLIIRLCRHTLPTGRRCQGAAVRGRACCRHHLGARARLHAMARARRQLSVPRLRVPATPADLARNRAELNRVVSTGLLDFPTARMMFWALDLAAAQVKAEYQQNLREARLPATKPHRIYQVPASPLFEQACPESLLEVIENTRPQGEGVPPLSVASSRHRKPHSRARMLQSPAPGGFPSA